MEVNIHHAKTNLSKLIAAAEDGEEVIIARNGKPAVKLVRVASQRPKSRKDMLGSGIGKISMAEDAFSPDTDLGLQKLFESDDPLLDRPTPRSSSGKKKSA
jgi:prevent-host-death family protein